MPAEGDAYVSFEYAVDWAIRRGVHKFISLGDLLNAQRTDSEPVVFLSRQIHKLHRAEISFLGLQGNHDCGQYPWFNTHPESSHIDKRQLWLAEYVFTALDYRPRGLIQEALADVKTPGLLTHQCWTELMGGQASTDCSFADVPGHVDLIITGDLHKFVDKTVRGRDGQRIRVLSPGSMCMQKIDEPPDKYFLVLYASGHIVREQLPTRQVWNDVPMYNEDHFEAFAEKLPGFLAAVPDDLPDQIRKPLVRVIYGHNLRDAARRVRKLVAGQVHLFEMFADPEVEETPQSQARRTRREQPLSFLHHAKAFLKGDHDTYQVSERLWTSQDPVVTLAALREEAFADNEVGEEEEVETQED